MKKTLLVVSILFLGSAFTFVNPASAYRGDPNVKGPQYSQERHEAMEKALETNNYEEWKKLMDGRGRVTQIITKENFAKFSQAHKLARQGKFEEAKKIRQELGLGLRDGSGQKRGGGCWNK